jgi:hypothetical protein
LLLLRRGYYRFVQLQPVERISLIHVPGHPPFAAFPACFQDIAMVDVDNGINDGHYYSKINKKLNLNF